MMVISHGVTALTQAKTLSEPNKKNVRTIRNQLELEVDRM